MNYYEVQINLNKEYGALYIDNIYYNIYIINKAFTMRKSEILGALHVSYDWFQFYSPCRCSPKISNLILQNLTL